MTRSTLSAFSLAAFMMQLAIPVSFAAGTCEASVLDTVAGLGTELSVSGCEADQRTTLETENPDHQVYTQSIVLDASGHARTLLPSKYTTTAGTYVFGVAGVSGSFTVLPDRADDAHSTLLVSPTAIAVSGSATVTALLRDRYDNPVAGRPLALIASRLTDEITARSKETDDSGRFLWTVRGTENGTSSLTVYDSAGGRPMKLKADLRIGAGSSALRSQLTGFEQGGINTAYAADTTADTTDGMATPGDAIIDRFDLSLPQDAADVKANELFSITLKAMRGSQLVRGYIGTLVVTSSDPDADLPKKGEDPRHPDAGRIDIRGVDQGERSVPLAFVLRSGGAQTISVYDKQDPSVTGILQVNVLQGNAGTKNKIVILDPKDRSTVKGGPILLQGRAPTLINLKVKGGSELVSGESDSEGVFRISVPLNPQDKEVTLFVQSENGAYESDPVHILIDESAPAIESITFDPADTKATGPATILVKSEPGLATVTATVGTESVTLTEGSGGMGLYRGTMTAPAKEGIYDVTVKGIDGAGNAISMLTKWTVKPKSLPVVQGVTAESQPGSVLLQWQPVTSFPVAEYKIYIALDRDPQNYLYSIATQKPLTSAVVKDLPLGQAYRFSLTAIAADGTESSEKSTPVIASPLGLAIKVTPGPDSLMLEWSAIQGLPLDHYVLEYGTASGDYPEKRTVSGQAVSTILHDLISGVTYELKLTPVTVTGKVLTELATVVRGTSGGSGFTPGTAEPVPTDIFGHPGAPLNPSPHITNVPSNTGSGFPSVTMGVLAVIAFVFGLHWRRVKRDRKLADEFLRMMQQCYHS